jgi:hypothetical protein
MNDYYVYTFSIDNIPFYVGSGRRRDEYTNPYRREWEHLKESRQPTDQQANRHKCAYLLKPHTFEVLSDGLTLERARELELELILKHKRICDGGTLTNIVVENLAHNTRRTPVFQFTTDGELLNKYTSIRQASQKTGILSSGIVGCCKGIYNSSGGFIWAYTNTFPGYTPPQEAWNKRSIDCYSLDGRLISTYSSGIEAAQMTGVEMSGINKCVRGGIAQSGGYVWVEAGGEFKAPPPRRSGKPKRKIRQINMKTMKTIRTFDSLTEAVNETCLSGIGRCALGLSKSSGGFHWEYIT